MSEETKRTLLVICEDCGHKWKTTPRKFGGWPTCPKCGSYFVYRVKEDADHIVYWGIGKEKVPTNKEGE